MTDSRQQSYCEYLGIQAPTIANYTNAKGVRPIQLFALAILCENRPLRLEEVSQHSCSAWMDSRNGRCVGFNTESRAGRLPIVQLLDGSYDLDFGPMPRIVITGLRIKNESHWYPGTH